MLHSVYDVFTPASQARLAFVPRTQINDDLVDALRIRGKQVIVFGETGSGKTTLVQRKLEELYPTHLTSRCYERTTFEDLVLDAFDQMSPFYLATSKSGSSTGITASLQGAFSQISATLSRSAETSLHRVLPPQLTPQRLGQFMGAAGVCWVLEDFHKVRPEQKLLLAQTFKIFMDLADDYTLFKVVAIGAVGTAREVVQYENDMRGRVAEIEVPLMAPYELEQILERGGSLLGVNFSSIAMDVSQFAAGMPGVCHEIALDLCLAAGIEETASAAYPLDFSRGDLELTIPRYVRDQSDTLTAAFEVALGDQRGETSTERSVVLSGLAEGPRVGLLPSEVHERIRRDEEDLSPEKVEHHLEDLAKSESGGVVTRGSGGKYRYRDPFYHLYARSMFPSRRQEVRGSFIDKIAEEVMRQQAAPGSSVL